MTGTTFSKTPVVIQDLKPNTRYSVTVQTLLGGRVVAEFTLDDLRTASNNSGPHELIGVGTTRTLIATSNTTNTGLLHLQFSLQDENYVIAELTIFSILMVLLAVSIVIFLLSKTL